MAKEEEENKTRGNKRRRSQIPDPGEAERVVERFNKKVKEEGSEPLKLQEDAPLELTMEMDNSPNTLLNPISDTERRKRLREILLIILTKLKKKDIYNILHQRPCSLMYPNYNLTKHIDMSTVAERVNGMCYYNVAQFRQAIQRVCECQTSFFPQNTIRHQFAIKFELYARKQTTYRALTALCDSLEIHEEMPRKQLRNMIIGTDLTTENPLIDSDKESESAEPQSPEPMAIEGPKTVDQETSLKIISGAPCEDLYNGNPVTLGDVTGKIIGAFDLPKKTRTIEDKAYTISYLNYGSYGSFAPVYDSRGASISKEDSEILFYDRKDPYFEELDKIANSDETSVTEYLARSLLGDEKAEECFDVVDPDIPPNPKELETLSELGIDTSFLEAFTKDGQEKVKSESLPDIMEQLSIIIPKLLAQQNSRLLSNSDRGNIKDEELAVAEKVQAYLAKALKLTAPGAACSVDAVRSAMGVQI